MRPLRRDALTLLVLCLTVYLAFAKGRPWIEATYQVERARVLLQHGTLASASPIAEFDIRGIDGRYYEVHGLLNTLVHLPFVAFDPLLSRLGAQRAQASDFISSMSGVVINSLTVMVFYILLRGLLLTRSASLVTAAALAFGTLVFPYSGGNYEGNADVLCLVLAAHYCFAFLGDRTEQRARHLAWCGLWCGFATLGRESNFALVGVIGLAVLWDTWNAKRLGPLVALAAAMVPFLLLLGWYNWIRTGSPFDTAITYRIATGYYPFFEAKNPYGILALIASPGGSMFVYSPMAILGLLGLRESWRRFPSETAIGIGFSVATLIAVGLRAKWFGFAGWGPRYMTPTLPFLLIGLAAWIDRPRRAGSAGGRDRAIVAAFFVPAVLIQVAGAVINWQARLGYLINRAGGAESPWNPMMFTIRQSQWWDALGGLCANIGYMITGRISPDALEHVTAGLSASSRYTTLTLDTWWNRLLFEGVSPVLISMYLAASAAIGIACLVSLRRQQA